ncbi:MAG: TadE family protein [Anaerolineales bacterium]
MQPMTRKTSLFHRLLSRLQHQKRGQSFIELALVLVIIMLLFSGMVEFGFMLNNYLHVVDGAREAARYSSSSEPFQMNVNGTIKTDGNGNIEDNNSFYYIAAAKAATTMDPILLSPENPDDIVISVFSVTTVPPNGQPQVLRFPVTAQNGWSLCANYAAFAAYFPTIPPSGEPVPSELSDPGWSSGCTVHTSQQSIASIENIINTNTPSAPNAGVVLVEIFYNYPQVLNLPVFTAVIPNPVPLYTYSIMPLSSAEPTPTP